jgi:hypothetical protein
MLATEKLSGVAVPVLAQTTGDTLVFADPNFMLFQRSEIVLVPDWERVDRLMDEHSAARSEWAWLVLPLRWGFPVSPSIGAGILAYGRRADIAGRTCVSVDLEPARLPHGVARVQAADPACAHGANIAHGVRKQWLGCAQRAAHFYRSNARD